MEPAIWRILLVDDDDEDFLITKSLFSEARGRKIVLDWAQTYEAGKVCLQADHYDAVLVDYDLGVKTGIEFIGEAVCEGYPAPLILYTGRGSYEVDVEAMQAGAALYLTKGEASPLFLERAIRYAIERKQSERALRDSEGSYRQLFNSMLDGFALHEMIFASDGKPVDYRFLEVNQAFEELTGLKAADILGKTVLEVLPGTEAYWIQIYGEVVLTGNSVRFENYHRTLEKYFEVVAFSPQKNQFAVIFTDITERRQMEAALRAHQEELEQQVLERTRELKETNEILEKMFSSINLLVALVDRDFNFIRVNDTYARADGRDPAFFVGKNHFALYPNEENEAIFRRVAATGTPFSIHAKPFEYPENPELGVTYWDWSLHPVRDEKGEVSSLLFTLVDVTEHQKAENHLAENAARANAMADTFERLFQSMPDATLLVDEGGMITRVNRQTERLFEYGEQELIGQPVEILLPEGARSRHSLLRSAFAAHPSLKPMGGGAGYAGRRKSGAEFPIDILLNPIEIQGRLNVICVVRDLTAQV